MDSLSLTSKAIIKASKAGYRADRYGNIYSPINNKLSLNYRKILSNMYYRFSFCFHGKIVSIPVHRLVAYQKFGIDALQPYMHVRHLNGNSLDNRLENIGIGTASENNMDKDLFLRKRLAINASSKIIRKDWIEIDADREKGFSYQDLKKKYGVSKSTLSYRYGKKSKKPSGGRLMVGQESMPSESRFDSGPFIIGHVVPIKNLMRRGALLGLFDKRCSWSRLLK